MKSLENFKAEKVSLKNVWGGGQIETNLGSTKDANGCTQTTTDTIYDSNGNGKQDKGEKVEVCITQTC